ncbi:MAG: flagellar biosynthesis anti-sigma factor FlgM [Burkholderiales bacterium]|nr:flagellar biosynthesis anti-sigma factor FlgM [Burkholderiales bacterium]
MKIGPLQNPAVPLKAEAPGAKPVTTPALPPQAEASAKVALSSTATQLAGAAGDGSFDGAKVGAISHAIHSGTYKINPEAIADKLMANAKELLSGKAG